jgi:hypothetical protein
LDGCLCVAGGDFSSKAVERYDVASDTLVSEADMIEGRRFFGAITIGSAGSTEELNLFDSVISSQTT